ncbi:hypothetical protein [Parabacteroides sp.]
MLVQSRGYQDVMNPNDKDYEFEAKVYMDLAAVCDEDSFSEPMGCLFDLYLDCSDLMDDYWRWIDDIERQK